VEGTRPLLSLTFTQDARRPKVSRLAYRDASWHFSILSRAKLRQRPFSRRGARPIGFALGPVLILYLVSRLGSGVTPWLMLPGVLLGVLVYALLPVWEPHGRRPLRQLFEPELAGGPVGALALASSFTSVAFITFTSSVPLWLASDKGYASDDPLIGSTLAVFSIAAGLGALLGGFLAPRIGRRATIVGSLLATPVALRRSSLGGHPRRRSPRYPRLIAVVALALSGAWTYWVGHAGRTPIHSCGATSSPKRWPRRLWAARSAGFAVTEAACSFFS
jgi:hypothetical protein